MDRQLVHLESDEVEAVIPFESDGSVDVGKEALVRVLSKHVGSVGLRVAASNLDYLPHEDGTPDPDTRTAAGIWWLPKGNDTSLIGGYSIEGHALTITTEGESESPLAEDAEVINRATRAIASQYEGSEVLESGLMQVSEPSGSKQARVFVTRDHRVRRPQDLLEADDLAALDEGCLGLVIVQMIGGDKALVVKLGI